MLHVRTADKLKMIIPFNIRVRKFPPFLFILPRVRSNALAALDKNCLGAPGWLSR